MTYSYTQISQYLRCPRSYRHRYLDGWREKETRAAMLFGRCFEKALAAYFLGEDSKFQMHAFVVLTTYNRADGLVFAGFRSGEQKFLRARSEQKLPALHFAAVLGPQQREAMDGSIPIPGFGSAGRDPQKYLLAGLDGDFRCSLAGNLVPAVMICREFDDPRLCGSVGENCQEKSRGGDATNLAQYD